MRIGIDASAMLIAQKNGYENYVTSLILAMAQLDAAELKDMELYLYFYAGNRLADKKLLDEYLPLLRKFKIRVYYPRQGFRVALPLLTLMDRLDMLHLPVYLWSKKYFCKVLTTVHDLCHYRFLREGYHYEAIKVLEQITISQIQISSAMIAISQNTKQDLIDFYHIDPQKIQVVYHGADETLSFSNTKFDPKKHYNLSPYLLSVNALQANKNYPRLLQSFALLREQFHLPHCLVIVGRNGWGYEAVHEEVKRLKLEPSVRFLGYVPREHLAGLYANADVVINSSLCEGFGLPILEALACNAVVAASSTTSFPEVGGAAVRYFDPKNIDDMAQVIYRLISDRGECERLRKQAPFQVSKFRWRTSAIDTLNVYRSLRGNPK